MILVTKTSALLVTLPSFLFALVNSQNNTYEFEDVGLKKVKFNYNPNSKIGPQNWHKIDTRNSEYIGLFGRQTKNTCNERMQSPVNIKPDIKCQDDHRLYFIVS